MYSGHYTTPINCWKKPFYCNDSKIAEFEMIDTKNSFTAYVYIDYVMVIRLEQDNEILITPIALAHPLHPIRSRSRNKRGNLWFG